MPVRVEGQDEHLRELRREGVLPPSSDNGHAPQRRTSWTAADLLVTDFPEPKWAIPGLVPEGSTILGGAPKLGKSWLLLCWCLAVASGGRALGKIAVDQGAVLYLALEDTPRRLRDRLRMILGDEPAPDELYVETSWPRFGDEGGGSGLSERIQNTPRLRLVVIDVLKRVRPVVSTTKGVYDADYEIGEQIKELADKHGIAIVVAHHTRKQGAEDWIDELSGSTGLTGVADTLIGLRRSRGEADAELNITGRDVDEASKALRFDPKAGVWRLLGEAAEYQLSKTRRQLLDAIRKHGPMTPASAAMATGMSPENAKKTLGRMANDGQLDVAEGTYTLPVTALTSGEAT